ncbi:MAG TPA: hypothetical protein ENJ82_14270 [Bacteroidetes bacterium]|nr:hypothetical protein [Bacteroidota bacterium]
MLQPKFFLSLFILIFSLQFSHAQESISTSNTPAAVNLAGNTNCGGYTWNSTADAAPPTWNNCTLTINIAGNPSTSWVSEVSGKGSYCGCAVKSFKLHFSSSASGLDEVYVDNVLTTFTLSSTSGNSIVSFPIPDATTSHQIKLHFVCTETHPDIVLDQIIGGGLCIVVDVSNIKPPPVISLEVISNLRQIAPIIAGETPLNPGLSAGFRLDLPLCKALHLGIDALSTRMVVAQPTNDLPQGSRLKTSAESGMVKWNGYSMLAGPILALEKGRLGLSLAAKAGLLFLAGEDLKVYLDFGNGTTSQENILSTYLGGKGSFALDGQINLRYAISKKLGAFIGGGYFPQLGQGLQYSARDAHQAIGANGKVNRELFSELPSKATFVQLKYWQMLVGLSFKFGPCR